MFLFVGGTISWKSAKQSVITASIMEVEFVASLRTLFIGYDYVNFILGLVIVDNTARPLKVCCDNYAKAFFSKNDKYCKGAKHMEIKQFTIKEKVRKQILSFEHINTNLMLQIV